MTDIVEMLRQGLDEGNLTPVGEQCKAAADEIESLRQQLAESQARETSCFSAAEFLKQLQHCQAREKVLRDYITPEQIKFGNVPPEGDSTALDEAIRKAKREALLEAAVKVSDYHGNHFVDNALNCGDELRKMAEEMK